jgi:hypothetical protein
MLAAIVSGDQRELRELRDQRELSREQRAELRACDERDGELTFLWAQADDDLRLPATLRSLAIRRRLICAWRVGGKERGVCFGIGAGRKMWGEEFFLLDRQSARARSAFAWPR